MSNFSLDSIIPMVIGTASARLILSIGSILLRKIGSGVTRPRRRVRLQVHFDSAVPYFDIRLSFGKRVVPSK